MPQTSSHDSPLHVGGGADPAGRRIGGWQLVTAVLELSAFLAVAASLIVFAQGAATPLVIRAAGAVLIVGAVGYGASRLFRPPRSVVAAVLAVLGAGLGIALILQPVQRLDTLGQLAGAALAARGVWFGVQALWSEGARWRRLAFGVAFVVAGAALVLLSEQLLTVALWIAVGVATVHQFVRTGVRIGITEIADAGGQKPLLQAWIQGKGRRTQDRDEVYEQIFFDGPTAVARTTRFGLMMLFAWSSQLWACSPTPLLS